VADVGLKNGVLLNCLTWYGDIILLFLPLNTSDEELGMVFHALAQAVAEVERRFL
jgi:adenosylmethionine-8-amino-7-oxononanoate aminotransferase